MSNDQNIAAQDPLELRMSLLVSALHYSWKTSERQSLVPTYLFHKIECIGLANSRLSGLKATNVTTTVRLISTLCVVEVSLVLLRCFYQKLLLTRSCEERLW